MEKVQPFTPIRLRATTPQDIADGFNYFAKTIRERARPYACRRDDPALEGLYDLWRGTVDAWRRKNRPDLPALPPLPGDHFFAGMANLADYCTQAANPKPKGNDGPHVRGTKVSKTVLALMLLSKHPDWTNQQIADKVPCHVKTLSNSTLFREAKKQIEVADAPLPPSKFHGAKTGRQPLI